MAGFTVDETTIPGLLRVELRVHGDNRGWFKENWQREKMIALGLPDFGPVQNNMSFNQTAGATRGIHAEPWDKLVSVATGRIFGVWIDLREGDTFGQVYTTELGPETAVFVPRGVGNGYQTLVDGTVYSYLVNDHWSAEARSTYTFVNLADRTLAIQWPIALDRAELSDQDRQHPALDDVTPFPRRKTLIVGATGQVGSALCDLLPDADAAARPRFDLGDPRTYDSVAWGDYDSVLNAAAFTSVDEAETETGRLAAWAANVTGVERLVREARRRRLTLVHISSDYVFDGRQQVHTEDEPFSPLGVYGQTKAAGDALVSTHTEHYIVRSSWVVGDGNNFVRTMASLADKGVSPSVIDDQFGRLTFTSDIARAIVHLVRSDAPFGTYNLTSAGPVQSWADIAATVFEARGRPASDVRRVSTADYASGKSLAPRPTHSTLDLTKIEATGFKPVDGPSCLRRYLEQLPSAAD